MSGICLQSGYIRQGKRLGNTSVYVCFEIVMCVCVHKTEKENITVWRYVFVWPQPAELSFSLPQALPVPFIVAQSKRCSCGFAACRLAMLLKSIDKESLSLCLSSTSFFARSPTHFLNSISLGSHIFQSFYSFLFTTWNRFHAMLPLFTFVQ